ncbi:hypothetical protein ACE38U_09275 [Cedecea sp. S5-13]|uniref:hypothetical protein n=1 Tax=Cedecea selenatireducens TaxID=3144416 RepID=UPI0035CD33C2
MSNILENNLKNVIIDLQDRAKKARRSRLFVGATILVMVVILTSFIAYRLTPNYDLDYQTLTRVSMAKFGTGKDAGLLELINAELNDAFKARPDKQNDISKSSELSHKKDSLMNAEKMVELYSKIIVANNSTPVAQNDDTISNLIATIALSAGIVGFVLYLMQIAVSFIRYYSRLAELYDSQITALMASGGNVESAKILMSILSNDHINLGKEPSTLYGKALDVIGDVAKSKSS